MSIIDHTLNKYDMLFCTYLDLLPLNLVYLGQENSNFVLENIISLAVGNIRYRVKYTKMYLNTNTFLLVKYIHL